MTFTDAANTTAGPAPDAVPRSGAEPDAYPGRAGPIDDERAALDQLLRDRPAGGQPDDAAWSRAYLDGVGRLICALLGSSAYSAPLRDIARQLRVAGEASLDTAHQARELAFIHAYAAAEISYLILTGADEAAAAQRIARQLVTDGIALPGGDDPRGWMRLLKWRDALRSRRQPVAQFDCYRARVEELKSGRRQ